MDNFIFVYFYDQENDKNNYYYKIMANKAIYATKIKRDKKYINDFYNIYTLSKVLQTQGFTADSDVYTANIKSIHTRLLIYLTGFNDLYTFDDGIGNILHTTFFIDNNELSGSKIFFSMFNPQLLYKNLRKNIKKHYTIYSQKNVYDNTQKIELFTLSKHTSISQNLPEVKILLTGPFSEIKRIDINTEIALYKYVMKQYDIDKVLPHPGEKNQKYHVSESIKTPLIAEEYFYELSKKYTIHLYGFYSSALINIVLSIPNIEVTNLHYAPICQEEDRVHFNAMQIKTDTIEL